MSQHADIIKFEIAEGIIDNLSTKRIIERIESTLSTLEYDDTFVSNAGYDARVCASWMVKQKDGLYGVSHAQLNKFINELDDQLNPNSTR